MTKLEFFGKVINVGKKLWEWFCVLLVLAIIAMCLG